MQWSKFKGCFPDNRVLMVLYGKATATNAPTPPKRTRDQLTNMIVNNLAYRYGYHLPPAQEGAYLHNIKMYISHKQSEMRAKLRAEDKMLESARSDPAKRREIKFHLPGDDWTANPPRLHLTEAELQALRRYNEDCYRAERMSVDDAEHHFRACRARGGAPII